MEAEEVAELGISARRGDALQQAVGGGFQVERFLRLSGGQFFREGIFRKPAEIGAAADERVGGRAADCPSVGGERSVVEGRAVGAEPEVGCPEAGARKLDEAAVGGVEFIEFVDSAEVGGEKQAASACLDLPDLHRLRAEHAAEVRDAADAVASVGQRRRVQFSAEPHRLKQLHAVRCLEDLQAASVLRVEHDYRAAASDRILAYGEQGFGRVGRRMEVAPPPGQGVPAPVGPHVADVGAGAQLPAGVAPVFAPEQPSRGRAVFGAGAAGAEVSENLERTVGGDFHQLVGDGDSAAHGEHSSAGRSESVEFGVPLPGRGQRPRGHEGRASGVVLVPEAPEAVAYLGEGCVELLPGDVFDGLAEVVEGDSAVVRDALVVAGGEVRRIVDAAHSGCGDVAYAVVVGGVEALRPVSPAPVVAEAAFGEADAEIFQEIGCPAAPSAGECRLRHHRVAFEEGRAAVECGEGA